MASSSSSSEATAARRDTESEFSRRANALLNDCDLDVFGNFTRSRADNAAAAAAEQPGYKSGDVTLVGHIDVDPERERHITDTADVREFTLRNGSRANVQTKGAPLSSLFTYTLRARMQRRRVSSSVPWYTVLDATREPKPLNSRTLAAMLLDVFFVKPSLSPLWLASRETPDAVYTMREVQAEIARLVQAKVCPMETASSFRQHPDLRHYFLHRKFVDLERAFGASQRATLDALDWSDVNSMHWRLCNEPHRMVFRRFIKQPDSDVLFQKMLRPLAALSLDDADAAASRYQVEPAPEMRLAIYMYEILRADNEENQHAYIARDVLVNRGRGYFIEHRLAGHTAESACALALKMLEEQLQVVVCQDVPTPRVQLRWVAESERAVGDALRVLVRRCIRNRERAEPAPPSFPCETRTIGDDFRAVARERAAREAGDAFVPDATRDYASASADAKHDAFAQRLGATAPDGACDEQQRAWTMLCEKPVLLVDGPGGSGKSALVRMIASRLPESWLCATAASSSACTVIADGVNGRAWNNHKLLHAHSQCLDPETRRHHTDDSWKKCGLGITYQRCLFERFRVLVVDEASLEHPSVLGPLLLLVVSCAPRLERIVLVGDHRQLPSIRWGSMWREMLDTFRSQFVVDFTHNHRVRGTNAHTLVENAAHIHGERPSRVRFDDVASTMVTFARQPYGMQDSDKRDATMRVVTDMLRRYKISEYDSQFVTMTNIYRRWINEAIEAYYLARSNRGAAVSGAVDGGRRHKYPVFHVGRKYMFTKNLYEWQVTNNEMLVLVAVEDVQFPTTEDITGRHWYLRVSPYYDMDTVRRELPADEVNDDVAATTRARQEVDVSTRLDTEMAVESGCVRFLVFRKLRGNDRAVLRVPAQRKFLKYLESGGCTTVDGAQGSQCRDVIYFMPYFSRFDIRERVYTAMTRATDRTFVCGRQDDFVSAVRNPAPVRRGSMADYLNPVLEHWRDGHRVRKTPSAADDDDDDAAAAAVTAVKKPAKRIRV